jgi:hypothetical protein
VVHENTLALLIIEKLWPGAVGGVSKAVQYVNDYVGQMPPLLEAKVSNLKSKSSYR